MNFLAAEATATGVRLAAGLDLALDSAAPPAHPVTVGIRPESIAVSLDGAGDLTATVKSFEQLGAITYIYTELPGGETLTVQQMSQLPLTRGAHHRRHACRPPRCMSSTPRPGSR